MKQAESESIKKQKKKIDWNQQIKKLILFAEKKDFTTKIYKTKSKISSVHLEKKLIQIYSGHRNEIKFYLLLHELGHVLLNENEKVFKASSGYGQTFFTNNTITNKVSIVEEELFAWDVGKNLAKEMKLKINRRSFERLKSHCISSYIKHLFLRQHIKKIINK